jgi:hypothetical protein
MAQSWCASGFRFLQPLLPSSSSMRPGRREGKVSRPGSSHVNKPTDPLHFSLLWVELSRKIALDVTRPIHP